jgi:3-oxoacyl-(acyl-carrier-protein) synthase
MAYYINSIASSEAPTREFKELVPAPDMRRRMGRLLRMGVAAGVEALQGLPEGCRDRVGAIITATRLGCLADSEKFLRHIIDQDETLLNPTPFIQSTFNTVGGQIAILMQNHGYNMTYVHGEQSFAHALVDTMIQLDQAGA